MTARLVGRDIGSVFQFQHNLCDLLRPKLGINRYRSPAYLLMLSPQIEKGYHKPIPSMG